MTEHKRLSRADRDALGRQNHADLMRLREGWDQVYLISVTFPDNWQAIRIGEPETVLTAASSAELREKMREDHERRPLPRRPSVSADADE